MARSRLSLVFVLVTFVGLAGSVSTSPVQAATRTTASITVDRPHPIAREWFTVSGRLSTRFNRPVTLRTYYAGAWRSIRQGRTTATGTYRFTRVSTPTTRRFYVTAAAARHAGRRFGRANTAVRAVAPVAQAASLEVLPKVSQRGATPAASASADSSVVARFTPARPGRVVTFRKQQRDGSWVVAGQATQWADGRAYYVGATSSTTRAVPFRATTASRNGARAVSSTPSVGDWSETFVDEFSGTALDLATWAYRDGASPSRTQATNDPRAVSVAGGTLRLRVLPDPADAAHQRLLNAQISTEESFGFTYGVASARIRFPRGRGQHSSFWLQSPDYGRYLGDAARSGAEVDVAEFFGDGYPQGGLAAFLYYKDASGHDVKTGGVWRTAAQLLPASDAWWKSYHVFSVRWAPGGYTFYVDGRVLFTSTEAIARRDEYLILSALTSDWEIGRLDRRTLPTTMSVDWAKVWQTPTSS